MKGDHSEAGYNIKNSPHLEPAFIVDEALMNFSSDLVLKYGIDPNFKSEEILSEIMRLWSDVAVENIRLWEYYVINVVSSVNQFKLVWHEKNNALFKYSFKKVDVYGLGIKDLAEILRKEALIDTGFGKVFSKMIDLEIAFCIIEKCVKDGSYCSDGVALFKELVDEMNVCYYEEYNDDMRTIHDQVRNRARYLRVADHGPRLGSLSRE